MTHAVPVSTAIFDCDAGRSPWFHFVRLQLPSSCTVSGEITEKRKVSEVKYEIVEPTAVYDISVDIVPSNRKLQSMVNN